MGYPTKVQLIKRKASQQWYVNFPAVLAQAMEFEKGKPWSGSSRTDTPSRCNAKRSATSTPAKKNARAAARKRPIGDGA